ncbi:MAG TPA: LLM class flavin-dependent oxidoreductase [Candidatus Methylomirabilis sp.]|nr:LLM class flavin-dependent oxidoreductase [Candidatus Methylomirabilis sp.]
MKVGVFIGTQHPAHADMRREFTHHLEQAEAIRDGGFDAVWIGQHYLTFPEQFFQTTPLLARLCAETGQMLVGTNLLLLPLHNVIDVAEQYATIDIITGGRLILGVGLGYRNQEYEAFGVERKTRAARFEEKIEALKLLWTQDRASYAGHHVRFSDVSIRPRPLQTPRPPLWIGAAADAAVARAATLGDAWIATSVTTFTAITAQVALYRRARAAAGLPPATELAKCVELYVADDRRRAFEESAPHMAAKYRSYYAWGMDANVPGESGKNLPLEELVKDRFIIGTPEDCIRECLAHRDALGVTHLIVRFNFPGMAQAHVLQAIRLFAREVLPAIRSAPPTPSPHP